MPDKNVLDTSPGPLEASKEYIDMDGLYLPVPWGPPGVRNRIQSTRVHRYEHWVPR